MAKKPGRCRNFGQCELADQRKLILADDFNFNCPKCGRGLANYRPPPPPFWRNPRTLLAGLAGLFAVAGLGWGALKYFEPKPPPPVLSAVGDCTPKPLLMDGKKTLYQRVLTRPGAELKEQPAPGPGRPLNPFLRYYVYERTSAYGQEWLKVGSSTRCQTNGWLNAGATVPWKQQLHLVFQNPAGHTPVLFFERATDINALLQSRQPAAELDPLVRTIRDGGSDPRIVAIEPENDIDLSGKFYLLPILDYQETRNVQDQPVTLLRVASINQAAGLSAPRPAATPTAAVVFVIDSTISMGPYIERTRAAVRQIYDRFQTLAGRNAVKFGLVGYRSNIRAVPGLEYDARLFADPNNVQDENDFLRKVSELRPARVSSSKFDEDAYGGVMTALKAIDWTSFTGKYLIVISDAGALDANDPLSSTRMGARDVNEAARDRNVVVYTIHLKTPEGGRNNNHLSAERQYKVLAANTLTPDPLYYSVKAGTVDAFGAQIDCLTHSVVHNVNTINRPVNGTDLLQYCPRVGEQGLDDELRRMRNQASLLGNALRLTYLGSQQGTQAPQVFESWIADKDLRNPLTQSVEVRVLLTRNELSDLHKGVEAILQAAQAGRSSPEAFYRSLREFAARKVRDPQQNAAVVGDLGIFDEYLQDLPYKSHVMTLDSDTWASWSASQQDEFIGNLTHKLDRYRYFEADVNNWVALTPDGDAGEKVYPIPLDALP